VSNAVSCAAVESDGFQAIQGEFNFIITNPPVRAGKQVIYKMFEDAKDRLCEGGVLLAVIRRKQGAESALRKLQEVFGNCETVARDKGYWVLRSERVDSFEEAC
jgi:16S rRNA (guanine1207-N2)-methyltransferase